MGNHAAQRNGYEVIKRTALLILLLAGCGKEPTLSERYPDPWQRNLGLVVTRALVRNQIEGCALAVMRSAFGRNSDHGEYLVYCTRAEHELDGRDRWDAYIVFPAENKVTPASPEVFAAIPPPPPETFGYLPLNTKAHR